VGFQVLGNKWPYFIAGITFSAFVWRGKVYKNLIHEKRSCSRNLNKTRPGRNTETKRPVQLPHCHYTRESPGMDLILKMVEQTGRKAKR